MHKLFGIVLLLLSVTAGAQKKADPAQFGKLISPDALRKHLFYIASKETEGRATGSPGIEKAAVYIENQFKEAGLQPGNKGSYRLWYTLYQDSLLSASIKVNGQTFNPGYHFAADLRQGKNHRIDAGEIVFAGYGIDDPAYSDYRNLDVKGKIVLIVDGEPKTGDTTYTITGTARRSQWGFNQNMKVRAAEKQGVKAVLVLVNSFPKFDPAKKVNRGSLYPAFMVSDKSPAVYRISDSVAMAILGDQFSAIKETAKNGGALKSASFKKNIGLWFEKQQFESKACNVIGVLPGTDLKDEYVVITGHMDHLGKRDTVIYYGADDDGSGTCAVMQIAHAFGEAKKAGQGPRRTLVFMTVSGEEMGLWGSDYYTRNPVFPLEKTTVNLNIDMIGRVGNEYAKDQPDSLNYVYVIGDDKISSDLHPLSEQANNGYVQLKLDYRYNDPKDPNRFYYRSDHYNFAEKGVPILFYFDGVHKDYHRATDTPDKINYDMYARRAQLVFHTGWIMANLDRMLKRDTPLNMPSSR